MVIVEEFGELIFVNDFLWDQFYVDAHVFRSFEWSFEVEIFHIGGHEMNLGF